MELERYHTDVPIDTTEQSHGSLKLQNHNHPWREVIV